LPETFHGGKRRRPFIVVTDEEGAFLCAVIAGINWRGDWALSCDLGLRKEELEGRWTWCAVITGIFYLILNLSTNS
jgi:hypothetical protein